ncbi:MAG TPA: ATPase [Clostridiales bacterium]|nr:ATPase [Clostridiales bacterium]
MNKFVNRKDELGFLEEEYKKNEASLVVIYGRRRVGKTTLISKFTQNKKAVYFLASEESDVENRKDFGREISEKFGDAGLSKNNLHTWQELFDEIINIAKEEKIIIVLDEFQYMCKVTPGFPSIIQKIWDLKMNRSNIMLILCGSFISMMKEQALNYSSPLYGRRTGQINLGPIKFMYYKQFFENEISPSSQVEFYSVTGGIPRYIELFKKSDDIYESIYNNILKKQSVLFEEANFLLEKEVDEVGSYFSVIKTIAAGNRKIDKIASILEMPKERVKEKIKILVELEMIEKQVPITEKNMEENKNGLYFIKDNFLEFYFKFVYPYKNYLEIQDLDYIMEKIKTQFIPRHVSYVYEDVCREKMWLLNKERQLPFSLMKLGRWWNKDTEIDILGLNEEERSIIYGECKYTESKVGLTVLHDLEKKARNVGWSYAKDEYHILFSKSGFEDNLMKLAKTRGNLYLVKLD